MKALSKFLLAWLAVPAVWLCWGGGSEASEVQSGPIVVYGEESRGRATASGELYEPGLLTAAHATLPIGTFVRVANLQSGKMVDVRINDRKRADDRIVVLSRRAADEIGLGRHSVAPGSLMVIPAMPSSPLPASTSGDGPAGERPALARDVRQPRDLRDPPREGGFDPLAIFRGRRDEVAPAAAPYVGSASRAPSAAPPIPTSGTTVSAPGRIAAPALPGSPSSSSPPPSPPSPSAAPVPTPLSAPAAPVSQAAMVPLASQAPAAAQAGSNGAPFVASTFTGGSPYRVQFGAFRREVNARELSDALASSGIPAAVFPSQANDLHLVLTQFAFPTAEEAQRWIEYEGTRRGWQDRPVVVR